MIFHIFHSLAKKKQVWVSWTNTLDKLVGFGLPRLSRLQSGVCMLLRVTEGFPQKDFNLFPALDSFGKGQARSLLRIISLNE